MKLNTIAITSCLAITSIAFAQNKEMNRDSTDIERLAPISGMQNIQSKQIVTTAPTLIVPKAENGQCGSSNASIIPSAPSSFLCSSGNPSGVTPSTQSNGTTIYTWNCAGTYGGATTSCMATQRIDPKCGAANGIVAQSAPTTNLCSVGTASGVILNGQTFNWTCNGNVFNDTQCSASYNPPTDPYAGKYTCYNASVGQQQCQIIRFGFLSGNSSKLTFIALNIPQDFSKDANGYYRYPSNWGAGCANGRLQIESGGIRDLDCYKTLFPWVN